MHITIDNVISEKMIDLSYPIHSSKEVAVISVFSDNIKYEVVKDRTIIDDISGNKKLILSRTYTGKELISVLEGLIELTQFENDERIIREHKLTEITEMVLNLDELDNTGNLEDGIDIMWLVLTSSHSSLLMHPSTRDLKTESNGE